jgi:hypothetical protein
MSGYHFHAFIAYNILSFSITLHKVTLLKIGVLIINELRSFFRKRI